MTNGINPFCFSKQIQVKLIMFYCCCYSRPTRIEPLPLNIKLEIPDCNAPITHINANYPISEPEIQSTTLLTPRESVETPSSTRVTGLHLPFAQDTVHPFSSIKPSSLVKDAASFESLQNNTSTLEGKFRAQFENCLSVVKLLQHMKTSAEQQEYYILKLVFYHKKMLNLVTQALDQSREQALLPSRKYQPQGVSVPLHHLTHELRGLLQAANLEIESKQSLDNVLACLKNIYKQLGNAIVGLHNFNNGAMRQLTAESHKFTLQKIKRTLLVSIKALARTHGMDIRFHYPNLRNKNGRPKIFGGDFLKIQKILLNFTRNAINYGKTRGKTGGVIDIFIDVKNGNGPSHAIMKFRVQDYGQGISQKDKKKLFTAHFKAQSIGSNSISSSGLGLSNSAAFARAMNPPNTEQVIGVESELGYGSVFWFIAPVLQVPESKLLELSASSKNSVTKKFDKPNASILWADDCPITRKTINFMLQREKGAKTKQAPNSVLVKSGEAAIKQCTQRDFDVVFLDQNMGSGLKGCQAANQIYRNAIALGKTPPHMIIVTGDSVEEIRKELAVAGLDKIKSPIHILTKGGYNYTQIIDIVNDLTKNAAEG